MGHPIYMLGANALDNPAVTEAERRSNMGYCMLSKALDAYKSKTAYIDVQALIMAYQKTAIHLRRWHTCVW